MIPSARNDDPVLPSLIDRLSAAVELLHDLRLDRPHTDEPAGGGIVIHRETAHRPFSGFRLLRRQFGDAGILFGRR